MFKKYITFIIALFNITITQAQTVINETDYPVGGGTPYGYKSDTGVISSGGSGSNILWDFSFLNSPNDSNYISSNCDEYCDTFPGANFYNKNITGNSNGYFIKNATGLYVNGHHSQNNGVTLNNKFGNAEQLLMFPIQYNASFADSFSCTAYYYYPGTVIIRSEYGTTSGVIDAYGTIKTPIGIYNNVLRLKLNTMTYVESGDSIYSTSYMWYQAGIGHSVMDINLYPASENSSYRYTTTLPKNVNGIDNIRAGQNNISIYPNPAQNVFRIKTERQNNYSIIIRNVIGNIVYETKQNINSRETEVITSGWTRGIYLIEVKEDVGNSVVRKLVME